MHEHTTFYTAKGGQGCTTTALLYGLSLAHRPHTTPGRYIDIQSHQPADLFAAAGIPVGCAPDLDPPREARPDVFVGSLLTGSDCRQRLVRDIGTAWQTDPDLLPEARRYLVLRPCFLAVRRAMEAPTPTAVILIDEPDRALHADDIANVLGCAVATIPYDPTIARQIDAGLICQAISRSAIRRMEQIPAPELLAAVR